MQAAVLAGALPVCLVLSGFGWVTGVQLGLALKSEAFE